MKEYIEKLIQSDALSDMAKQKITSLASGDMTPDVIAQIQNIVQAEIDSVFDEAGIVIEESEVQAKMNDLEKDLSAIESAVSEDSELVKKELDNLEDIADQIESSLEQDRIDDLKKEITA